MKSKFSWSVAQKISNLKNENAHLEATNEEFSRYNPEK